MNSRTNQLDRTRTAIVEATTDLLLNSTDPNGFTMQNVADAAGVSHRTLYRHFASREELINTVGATMDRAMAYAEDPLDIGTLERWLAATDDVMAFGATHRDMLRRVITVEIASGQWRTDRDTRYWELFRARFPHLDEATAREDFAALRHLLWSGNAIVIGERFGLEAPRVAAGVARAAQAFIADIAARDAAAAEEQGR